MDPHQCNQSDIEKELHQNQYTGLQIIIYLYYKQTQKLLSHQRPPASPNYKQCGIQTHLFMQIFLHQLNLKKCHETSIWASIYPQIRSLQPPPIQPKPQSWLQQSANTHHLPWQIQTLHSCLFLYPTTQDWSQSWLCIIHFTFLMLITSISVIGYYGSLVLSLLY